MFSFASVRSALDLVLVCGFFMFFLGLYLGHLSVSKLGLSLSVLQSYWNLHVWNRREALFLSSVSRYLGLSIVFSIDLEYFALLSSVGCMGTLMVSVVSERPRLPSKSLRLLRSSSGASRSLPLAGHCPSLNHELLNRSENDNLWVLRAFDLKVLCGYCEKSFPRVSSNCPDAEPEPRRACC